MLAIKASVGSYGLLTCHKVNNKFHCIVVKNSLSQCPPNDLKHVFLNNRMIHIYFLKQPIPIDSVRSCDVPKVWASSICVRLDHCRIVVEKWSLIPCELFGMLRATWSIDFDNTIVKVWI